MWWHNLAMRFDVLFRFYVFIMPAVTNNLLSSFFIKFFPLSFNLAQWHWVNVFICEKYCTRTCIVNFSFVSLIRIHCKHENSCRLVFMHTKNVLVITSDLYPFNLHRNTENVLASCTHARKFIQKRRDFNSPSFIHICFPYYCCCYCYKKHMHMMITSTEKTN